MDNFFSHASPETLHLIHWLLVFPAILVGTAFLCGKRFWALSFPLIFMLGYVVLIFIQGVRVYLETVSEPKFLLSVWLVPFLYLAGHALIALPNRRLRQRATSSVPVVSFRDQVLGKHIMPFVTIVVIALPLVYIADRGVNSIALFFALLNPGNALEAMNMRIGGLESNIHPLLGYIYSYGRTLLLPISVPMLAVLWNRRVISRFHFFTGIIAALFFSVLTAAKAPMTFLILAASFSVYLAYGCPMSRKVARIVVVVFLLGFIVPALIYPLLQGKSGSEGLAYAFERLFTRMTWVPSYSASLYFEAFGNFFPFLEMSSNKIFAWLAGEPVRVAAAMIHSEYLENSIEGGLVNAAFFASFYADWGMNGVIWGTLLVGLLSGGLQVFFDSREQDLTTTGVKAAVLVACGQLVMTNFYSVALGRGFLSIPLMFFFYDLLWPKIRAIRVPRPINLPGEAALEPSKNA